MSLMWDWTGRTGKCQVVEKIIRLTCKLSRRSWSGKAKLNKGSKFGKVGVNCVETQRIRPKFQFFVLERLCRGKLRILFHWKEQFIIVKVSLIL